MVCIQNFCNTEAIGRIRGILDADGFFRVYSYETPLKYKNLMFRSITMTDLVDLISDLRKTQPQCKNCTSSKVRKSKLRSLGVKSLNGMAIIML